MRSTSFSPAGAPLRLFESEQAHRREHKARGFGRRRADKDRVAGSASRRTHPASQGLEIADFGVFVRNFAVELRWLQALDRVGFQVTPANSRTSLRPGKQPVMPTLTSRFVAAALVAGTFSWGIEAASPAPELTTTVFGYVWNARNEPIPQAPVRMRNATTGRVEANAVANSEGEFAFENVEGGTYVLEYVDQKGRVLAVGHVFSIEPGETVATFIRLNEPVSRFAAVFGRGSNVAAAAIVSAASLGLSAVAPSSRDVTPER
jgi:hypothetical protein